MDNISWEIEDDDENFESNVFHTGPYGLIFLIDVSPSMFERSDCEDRPIILALKACKEIIISLIKKPSNKNIHVGIAFYGTEKNENQLQLNNVCVEKKLGPFNAETIKNIMNLINEMDHDVSEYNFSPYCPLKNGIAVVQQMFFDSTAKYFSKRIALMTATSNPNEDLFGCRLKAKDLQDFNMRLDLFPFGSNFDIQPFFKELLEEASGIYGIQLPDPILTLDQLLKLCTNLDFHPRGQNKLNLFFSEQFKVYVTMYACSFEENWSIKPVKLERTSNDLLRSQVTYHDKETGRPIEPKQLKYKYKWNGHTLIFTQEERKKIRSLRPSGIRIIQFLNRNLFKWDYHHRPCHFLTCSEGNQESEEIIDSLLSETLERDVSIHCWMTNRQGSKTLQVLLEPYIPATTSTEINMISSPGFLIYFLPFKQLYLNESFRKTKFEDYIVQWSPSQKQEDNLINALSKVVNQSDNQFNPPPDPYEDTFMSNLEALALGYSDAKPVQDHTIIQWPSDFNLEEISKELYGSNNQPHFEKTKQGTKRSNSSKDGAPHCKKPAISRSEEDIKILAEADSLNICTVIELKEYATTLRLKNLSKCKKNDLITKIKEYFM